MSESPPPPSDFTPLNPGSSDPKDQAVAVPTDNQWKAVFEESSAGLRAFLRSRLAQASDVDDCMQAVYVKMLQSGHKVATVSRRAWLFRVAANESALLWRNKASTERMLQQHSTHDKVAQIEPTEQLITSESSQMLRQAMDDLPTTYREVIRLRIANDLTFQQIANQLNIPLGTALTRMRRGLERLREQLPNSDPPE